LTGLLVTLFVVLPWVIAIGVQSHGAFFRQSLGHDFGDKLVGGQESHGAPPGYYLALATLTLWPAILFVLPALRTAWIGRSEPALRYLLVWAGASWFLFELVPTKLPHYVLPAYPALVILAAYAVFGTARAASTRLDRALRIVASFQFVLALAAFIAVAVVLPRLYGTGTSWPVVAVAGLGAAVGAWAVVSYLRGREAAALAGAIGAAVIMIPMLTVGIAPRLDAFWVSPHAAALAHKDSRPGDPPPVIAGYAEPSLIFLLGTDTRVSTGEGAAAIAAQQGGLAIVEDRARPAFLGGLGARDAEAFPIDAFQGYDYSHGRRVHLTLYRVAAGSTASPGE
jgi:4-amino-4-deoxy-L-arabinose transferase-like glycosyltransferase